MHRLLFIIVFGLLAARSIAQQKELDSLLPLLHEHNQEDTVKLKLLLDIAFDYSLTNPDKGLATADEAIALAGKLNDRQKLSVAYNYKGVNYQVKGEDSLAIDWLKKGLAIRQSMHDTLGTGKSLHNLGISYFNLSDYVTALDYHQQALNLFTRLNNRKAIAGSLNSIGVIYLTVANYPQALDVYYKALHVFEAMNDSLGMGNVFTNIGLVNYHLNNLDKALDYHSRALNLFRLMGSRYQQQLALGNIGNCYDEINDPAKALLYYKEALDITREMGLKSGMASTLSNMGAAYNKLGDYTNAIAYSQKSLDLYEQLGNKLGIAFALGQMGLAYRKAPASFFPANGLSYAGRYRKSLDYYKRSLEAAQSIGALDAQGEAWEQLSDTYALQHDFPNALAAYKNYSLIKDSIINDEKKLEITRKEMQYGFDRQQVLLKAEQDKKQAIDAAEINRQRIIRNTAIAGGAILLLAGLSIFIFYKRKRDAEEHRKEAEFKAQVADTEMKALRSQMNPHFIFNSLNSIGDYILKNNTRAADEYLAKFAKLMRMTLEHSEQKEVKLADDLKALELYIQLESLRLNNTFTYEITVDEQIDPETTLIPPMILQPFVENSIWHGISKKHGEGRILIQIRKEGEMINCVVEDNGIGRGKQPPESSLPRKSLGMKITRSRIDILNKMKNTHASVQLSDLSEGMRAEVKLPLELSF